MTSTDADNVSRAAEAAPKILGVSMTATPNPLHWRMPLGNELRVWLTGGYGDGPRSWCAKIGDEWVAVHAEKEEAIAAIERELLAIRDAIPQKETDRG